jgi:outer membrane protein
MKNLSLVLNAILLVAVAALYYLHFSTPRAKGPAEEGVPSNLKVAYIKSDTVLKYYDYFKVNKDKIEAKGKRLDQDLKSRAQSLQNEFENYQRNASNLTMGQARAVEEDLGKKRQNLQLYQESLSQEMLAEQNKMTKDLYTRVTDYLKTYGQERGLQVVLKNDETSDLLYGSDSLDISADVIKGLNELYKAEQATPAAKKDTTAVKKK